MRGRLYAASARGRLYAASARGRPYAGSPRGRLYAASPRGRPYAAPPRSRPCAAAKKPPAAQRPCVASLCSRRGVAHAELFPVCVFSASVCRACAPSCCGSSCVYRGSAGRGRCIFGHFLPVPRWLIGSAGGGGTYVDRFPPWARSGVIDYSVRIRRSVIGVAQRDRNCLIFSYGRSHDRWKPVDVGNSGKIVPELCVQQLNSQVIRLTKGNRRCLLPVARCLVFPSWLKVPIRH